MTSFLKEFILLLLLVTLMPKGHGQENRFKEKKYIFLLDVTKSMWGCCGSEDIFDDVRNHLIKAINNVSDPKTEIVVSTYQEKIIATWKVKATTEGKKSLISNLNNINEKNVPGQNTNLYGAWIESKRQLDPSKINVVFVLTDGDHNDKNVPVQKLYDEIPKWKDVSKQQQAYIFMVELTKLAIDQKVRNLVNQTPNTQIIHGIEFFVLEILQTNPILNIDDELTFKFNLIKDNWDSKYNNVRISLSLNNPYFRLNKSSFTIKELPEKVILIPKIPIAQIKKQLAQSSEILIQVAYDAQNYPQIKILNNRIKVLLNNKKEKVLSIEVLN